MDGPPTPDRVRKTDALIAAAFDVDYFCYRMAAESWPGLSPARRDRLRGAVAHALAEDIRAFIGQASSEGPPRLRFVSNVKSGRLPSGETAAVYLERQLNLAWEARGSGSGAVEYRLLRYELEGRGGESHLVFAVGCYPDGRWLVTDIFYRGDGLAEGLRQRGRAILKKYSLPYLVAEFSGSGVVILEDWSAGTAGGMPPGWRWKKSDNGRRKPYLIDEEGGERYLKADDRGESVVIGREMRWNLEKYPYLAFRWRARKLPEGGDESRGKTNDSAAGISLLYELKLGVIPKSVKYVWSTTLPVGSTVRRDGAAPPWVIVADSGEEHLGAWRYHVVNAYEAYRSTFGSRPPTDVVGIGILTDANATSSSAAADYGVIAALTSPAAAGPVDQEAHLFRGGVIMSGLTSE